MKKLIFTAFAALVFAIPAFSQIKLQKESNNKTTEIVSVRAGAIHLEHSTKLGYYIILPTSNRFDDPVMLGLGDSIDAALQSMESFMNMYDEADEYSANVSDELGQKIHIRKWGAPGKGSLTFKVEGDVQAGVATIHRFEMAKMQRKLIEFIAEE